MVVNIGDYRWLLSARLDRDVVVEGPAGSRCSTDTPPLIKSALADLPPFMFSLRAGGEGWRAFEQKNARTT